MTALRESGSVLVASCAGDQTGGGFLAYDGQSLEVIDRLSSAGLRHVGGRLLRLLLAPDAPTMTGEFLVYDRLGIERYYRSDAAGDAHDMLWDGSAYVIVSSATNTILWISAEGEIARTWKARGDGDCWHLNCVAIKDGELYVTGFGRYTSHRAWVPRLGAPDGFLMNVRTGEDVLQGLVCPHSPRWFDGGWAVCNSARSDVAQFDESGREVVRRARLRGWTRGMAVGDDVLFVGESGDRHGTESETGTIAVVDRKTWDVLDRIPVPYTEIGELVLVPASLLDGLRAGFRTNPHRRAEQDQLALFREVGVEPRRLWAVSDPLTRDECRVQVDATVPLVLRAGDRLTLPCTVTNLGNRFLVSAAPYPVSVACKWLPADGAASDRFIESERSPLPRSLPPGERDTFNFRLPVPNEEGEFLLRVTLVQDGVCWFDDVDTGNAYAQRVRIVARETEAPHGEKLEPMPAIERAG